MQIHSVHYATVLYDIDLDYNDRRLWEIRTKLEDKLKEILDKHPEVSENTNFCCQSNEGHQIQSESIECLTLAAKEFRAYFNRFKCLKVYE